MRASLLLAFALFASSALAQTSVQAGVQPPAQATQEAAPLTTLRASTSLVYVPVQVQTKKGDTIYTLRPDQFTLEDNGAPVKFRMEDDPDAQGLALVVVVQCSRTAFEQFERMRGLGIMVDDLTGGAPRQVAVVAYGAEPQLVARFSSNAANIDSNMDLLQPCEDGANATLDAVAYAEKLFDDPAAHNKSAPVAKAAQYRRAILLIGETRDHGSAIKPEAVVASLGRSNTVVDAVSFNPGKTSMVDSLIHGRFGPGPFGLLIMAVEALRRNVPHTLATLTGGEYTNFTTQKGFDAGVHRLANDIHNYYLLSFTPTQPTAAGLHQLEVKVPDYSDAVIRSRLTYYSGDTAPPAIAEQPEHPEPAKP